MKTDFIKLVLALIVLVIGGAAEEILPKVAGVGWPVLMASSLFFAMRRGVPEMVMFAIAAGAFEDALCSLPAATSSSFFLAAAALIKGGHAAKAMDRFNKTLEARVWYEDNAPHDLMSQAARFGMTLSIIMDIAPDNAAATDLALQLRKAIRKDGYAWGTTQANAWGTGALAKYAAHFKHDGNSTATFQADQKEPVVIDANKINKWDLQPNHTITVTNTGDNTIFILQHIDGTPKNVPQTQSGVLKLTREYLDKNGTPATTFKQGDLITVKITLESLSDIPNLVFADVLPGGMEIEDPTLVTRAAALTDEQAKPYGILSPKYIERRDDRYLLFGDLSESGIAVITYQARAVTRGKYVTPPSLVEAMYAPDLKAVFTTDSTFEVE